jgi:hypothetical protein
MSLPVIGSNMICKNQTILRIQPPPRPSEGKPSAHSGKYRHSRLEQWQYYRFFSLWCKVSIPFPTPAVNNGIVKRQRGYNREKKEIETGKIKLDECWKKESRRVSENLVSLNLRSKRFGKQNQNYQRIWTQRIENKAITKVWTKWSRWSAA